MILRRRSAAVSLAIPLVLGIGAVCQFASAAPPSSSGETVRRASTDRANAKVKPFTPEKLLRAFKGNREDLRHKALDDAERYYLADPQLAPALWQAIEPALKAAQTPESLLRAVRLYGRLSDPEVTSHLISLLSAADPRVVQAAVDILAQRRPAAALEKLMGLKEHPTFRTRYGFRHAVVSAVAGFNEPASVGFLVAAVGSFDGQLKYEAVRQLMRLTGENFGGRSEEWRKWWNVHRDGFQVTAARAAPGPKMPGPLAWDYDVPQFFGTSIYAKRLVFV